MYRRCIYTYSYILVLVFFNVCPYRAIPTSYKTITSYYAPSVTLSATNSGSSIDNTNIKKSTSSTKGHKNKYSKFSSSKNIVDPIEETIKRIELEIDQQKQNELKSLPNRGTTVPVFNSIDANRNISSISNTTIKNAVVYENISAIVPSDPYTFGYCKIGTILGPHGVKGEVRLQMESDFGDYRVRPTTVLYVKRPNRMSPRPISILSGRKANDNIYLVFFNNVRSRLAAASLKKFEVYVKNVDRPVLDKDEYIIRDLVGLMCYIDGKNDKPIATVEGIVPVDELCTNAAVAHLMHSILELRLLDSKELCLVPLVPEIVKLIDIAKKRIIIDPPQGLLDLTYVEKVKVSIKGFLPASCNVSAQRRKQLAFSSVLMPY